MYLERAKWAAVAAAAVLAFTAFSGDARAQAFNVSDFSCSTNPFGVNVAASGLGHTDLCVTAAINTDLNCACANDNGGNCTRDANKNTTTTASNQSNEVRSKNGSVDTTVGVTVSATNSQCTAALACPSGQTAKMVSFSASVDFSLCAITNPGIEPSDSCNCSGQTVLEDSINHPLTCTTSGTGFSGKKGSCAALFPS